MTFKLTRTEWYVVLFCLMTQWAIMLQHRFVSLPFYLLFIGFCLTRRWHRRDWVVISTAAAFFLSSFSPVDIYVPRWSGRIIGTEKSGTRFVWQAKGLHGAALHVMRYGGECVDGGCLVDAFCDAKWMLVLDWTNRSATRAGISNFATNSVSPVTNSDVQHERSNSTN